MNVKAGRSACYAVNLRICVKVYKLIYDVFFN